MNRYRLHEIKKGVNKGKFGLYGWGNNGWRFIAILPKTTAKAKYKFLAKVF